MTIGCEVGGEQELRLKSALLFYTDGSNGAFVTMHEAGANDVGLPELGPGVAVSSGHIKDIVRQLTGKVEKKHFLPERMLWCDYRSMGWWVPASRRPMFIKADGAYRAGARGALNGLSGQTFQHPALVMEASKKGFRVFALAENKRPEPATKLYKSPYFNIYQSGLMCQGNVPYPKRIHPDDMAKWEHALFGTVFTHSNAGKLVKCPDRKSKWADFDYVEVWRRMRAKRAEWTEEYLIEAMLTLKVTRLKEEEGAQRCLFLRDLL